MKQTQEEHFDLGSDEEFFWSIPNCVTSMSSLSERTQKQQTTSNNNQLGPSAAAQADSPQKNQQSYSRLSSPQPRPQDVHEYIAIKLLESNFEKNQNLTLNWFQFATDKTKNNADATITIKSQGKPIQMHDLINTVGSITQGTDHFKFIEHGYKSPKKKNKRSNSQKELQTSTPSTPRLDKARGDSSNLSNQPVGANAQKFTALSSKKVKLPIQESQNAADEGNNVEQAAEVLNTSSEIAQPKELILNDILFEVSNLEIRQVVQNIMENRLQVSKLSKGNSPNPDELNKLPPAKINSVLQYVWPAIQQYQQQQQASTNEDSDEQVESDQMPIEKTGGQIYKFELQNENTGKNQQAEEVGETGEIEPSTNKTQPSSNNQAEQQQQTEKLLSTEIQNNLANQTSTDETLVKLPAEFNYYDQITIPMLIIQTNLLKKHEFVKRISGNQIAAISKKIIDKRQQKRLKQKLSNDQPPANSNDQPPANSNDQPEANSNNQPPANSNSSRKRKKKESKKSGTNCDKTPNNTPTNNFSSSSKQSTSAYFRESLLINIPKQNDQMCKLYIKIFCYKMTDINEEKQLQLYQEFEQLRQNHNQGQTSGHALNQANLSKLPRNENVEPSLQVQEPNIFNEELSILNGEVDSILEENEDLFEENEHLVEENELVVKENELVVKENERLKKEAQRSTEVLQKYLPMLFSSDPIKESIKQELQYEEIQKLIDVAAALPGINKTSLEMLKSFQQLDSQPKVPETQ